MNHIFYVKRCLELATKAILHAGILILADCCSTT